MDSHSFDLWAGDYDKSVEAADNDNLYPFAGYKELMNQIYGTVMNRKPASVLDIGIGAGVLLLERESNGSVYWKQNEGMRLGAWNNEKI